MLTRDPNRHFECHFITRVRLAGLWSGASGVNAIVASGEEREAGLRPSLLSSSLWLCEEPFYLYNTSI